ncbi:MAG: hypothetical protein JWO82_2232 [Akkermansiaceae bacterium]|nr:hypothetical protein [Akkermansiaceae bacterium]
MSRYLLLIPLLAIAAHADPLKDADREALLERLDKLSDAADAKVDARFKVAVGAFRAAMASDSATMDLYLKCVEKVEYEDNYKKSQDFRDWKRKEAETLEKGGFRAALRYQLGWLLLTLEAASSKGKPPGINARMESMVDSIYADADKLKDGHDELAKSATDSVFAKAYDLHDVKVEDWPGSPIELNAVFLRNLIPPYRSSSHIPELRAEWAKYIKYEGIAAEKWPHEREEDKRVGTKEAIRSSEYDKFLAEKMPALMWDMEVDAFKSGDQKVASTRMLAHIEKYVTHNKAPAWTKQFRKLVSGVPDKDDKEYAPVPPKSAPAPAPAADTPSPDTVTAVPDPAVPAKPQ